MQCLWKTFQRQPWSLKKYLYVNYFWSNSKSIAWICNQLNVELDVYCMVWINDILSNKAKLHNQMSHWHEKSALIISSRMYIWKPIMLETRLRMFRIHAVKFFTWRFSVYSSSPSLSWLPIISFEEINLPTKSIEKFPPFH